MVFGRGADSDVEAPASLVPAALATYATNLLVAVLSLLNVLIVARALGPTGRGDVAFLTTIALLTAHVAELGVQQANANVAAIEPRRRRALAANSVLLALVFGAAAIAAVALLVEAFPVVGGDVNARLRWLALAAIPVLILQTYLLFLVQADYRFVLSNAVWLLPAVGNVTVNGAAAALGVITVGTAVAVWVGGQALATTVLVWSVARRGAGFGRPDLGLARSALGFGLKSHPGRVMTLGNYRLDQWFLGAIAGSRELGLYSVAVAWAEALFYLPTALQIVQRPELVRRSRREAGRQAAKAFRAAVLITAVLAAGLVVAAPVLCVGVFGEQFRGSIDDLRVLALGAFGMIALKLFGNALTAQGRPLLATAAVGVAFAATVALDLLLIPPHGGVGAALASTIAYTLGGAAVTVVFARALSTPLGALVPRVGDIGWLWRTARTRFRPEPAARR